MLLPRGFKYNLRILRYLVPEVEDGFSGGRFLKNPQTFTIISAISKN